VWTKEILEEMIDTEATEIEIEREIEGLKMIIVDPERTKFKVKIIIAGEVAEEDSQIILLRENHKWNSLWQGKKNIRNFNYSKKKKRREKLEEAGSQISVSIVIFIKILPL